ncbi:hypothetical protein Tco_0970395 [Tanacetum coccineum]
MDDDSGMKLNNDIGYDPSDIRGYDEVELTDEESSDDKDKAVEGCEWYEALEENKLKNEALRNKTIMEGFIKEEDDESHYEHMRRWNINANYDDTYEINHEDNENEELFAVKEDEYDDPIITREEACRAYLEIFWKMDEGWMVTRAVEVKKKLRQV